MTTAAPPLALQAMRNLPPIPWPPPADDSASASPAPAAAVPADPVAADAPAEASGDRARRAWATADNLVGALTGVVVLAVASFAAVVSYSHIYELGRENHEDGTAARMMPLTVDGLIASASLVMLRASMKNKPVPAEARLMLWLGVGATIAANVGYGLPYGWKAAVIASWPAVAFIGSVEMGVKFIMLAHGQGDDSDSGAAKPAGPAKPRQARAKRQRRRWRPRVRLVWRRRPRGSGDDTESVNANLDDSDRQGDSDSSAPPLTGKALAKHAITQHPTFDDKQIAAETGLSLRTVQRARGELAKPTTKRKAATR